MQASDFDRGWDSSTRRYHDQAVFPGLIVHAKVDLWISGELEVFEVYREMKLPAEPESINAFAGKDRRYVSQTGVYFMDEMKKGRSTVLTAGRGGRIGHAMRR